jgi:hypothetical protein
MNDICASINGRSKTIAIPRRPTKVPEVGDRETRNPCGEGEANAPERDDEDHAHTAEPERRAFLVEAGVLE